MKKRCFKWETKTIIKTEGKRVTPCMLKYSLNNLNLRSLRCEE